MRHRLLIGGGLLLAAALCLAGYNLWDNARAGEAVESVLEELGDLPAEPAPTEAASEQDTPQTMPTVEAQGNDYIGVLELPSLYIKLPVISDWSDSKLKLAPCRYKGSVYENDLIIAGHNYRLHFRSLNKLAVGDEVRFTDMDGHQFSYTVSEIQQLPGTAIEEMEAGEWDLTLFTCTLGGQARLTLRCVRNDL